MIIIYPTETCYGIGCSALDIEGVKKIFELKKRPNEKPFIVLVDSIDMLKKIARVNKTALELAEKYWPGPLSIVLPKKDIIPDEVSKGYIACRISSNKVANKIIKEIKAPLISTSANISGKPSPYSIKDIDESLIKGADLIIDKGELEKNPPSTVVKIDGEKIIMLRKGSIIF
jgi:L-threonylcarbamoyladenylate synthase